MNSEKLEVSLSTCENVEEKERKEKMVTCKVVASVINPIEI